VESSALLLLDLQNEMVDPKGKVGGGGLAAMVEKRGVLENAAAALQHARAANIPVVYVRLGFRADYSDALSRAPRVEVLKNNKAAILGTFGTQFPDSIAPGENDLIVTKQCVNPFHNTGLANWLFAKGITHLIFGGVATNLVVESTARAADDMGFTLTALEDVCASPNQEWHDFSAKNILPLFAKVSSVAETFG